MKQLLSIVLLLFTTCTTHFIYLHAIPSQIPWLIDGLDPEYIKHPIPPQTSLFSPNSNTNNDFDTINDTKSCTDCQLIFNILLPPFRSNPQTFLDIAITLCHSISTDETVQQKCITLSQWLVKTVSNLDDKFAWNEIEYCAFLMQCVSPCCLTDDQPEQIYSLIGTNDNDRWIVFAMYQQYNDAKIQITTDINDFNTNVSNNDNNHQSNLRIITPTSETYTTLGFKGYIYNGYVDNLTPGIWYYRVGRENNNKNNNDQNNTNTNQWSEIYQIHIYKPNTIGTDQYPLRVIIMGDIDTNSKQSEPSWLLLTKVLQQANNIHLVLLLGDLGYNDCSEYRSRLWGQQLQNVFTTNGISLLTIPGNHENYCYTNFKGYSLRFPRTNGNDQQGNNKMYHSISYMNLFILMFNPEHPTELNTILMDDEQLQWAEKTLQFNQLQQEEKQQIENESNKTTKSTSTQWLIAASHRPLYCSINGNICNNEATYLRDKIEPLLIKYDISMFFSGHQHTYERYHKQSQYDTYCTSQKMFNSKVQNNDYNNIDYNMNIVHDTCQYHYGDTIHILSGAGGNRHGIDSGDHLYENMNFQQLTRLYEPNAYTPINVIGMSMLTVTPNKLEQTFVDSEKEIILDTITIVR